MPVPTPAAQLARGFAMGTADIVPGVSGGTVALVLGIYERLVRNIHTGAQALRALDATPLLPLLDAGDREAFQSELAALESQLARVQELQ